MFMAFMLDPLMAVEATVCPSNPMIEKAKLSFTVYDVEFAI